MMIYKITNRLNRKIYVGQTRQSIEKRFIQHSKADSPLGLKVSPLLIMGIDDVENLYKPVNKDELELLSDYRDVNAEDRNMVRGMLKRFKIGRHLVSNPHVSAV